MRDNFDSTDRSILALLQEDASLTAADVAEKVGLSQSPCWRRIARLERLGIIRRRVALLDSKKLGLGVTVFAEVNIGRGSREAVGQFEDAVRGYPEVQECHMLMGDTDYLLKVVTRDVAAYEEFLREKLARHPAVGGIRSSMALKPVKESTSLPLDLVSGNQPGG
jgi:Lrp/AsnC family transcriptional regulator